MEALVARQPIFDREEEVYGYELLYRDGVDNAYNSDVDGDEATSQVLSNSFLTIGIDEVTGGKRAFINFTGNLLKDQTPVMFDNQIIVIEVLETVKPTEEIIAACRELKEQGYILALDDFVFSSEYISLLKLADIIKVDFLNTDKETRRKLVKIANKLDLELLAEKVETREEFETAVETGYSYFQGYFFSKPVLLKGKDLPTYPGNYLHALQEINRSEPDIDKVAEAISRDVSLSYKLLQLINSAAFMVRNEVDSIKNALMLLGIDEVEKWLNLMVVREIGKDKAQEVVRISLIRAKFAELIAERIGEQNRKSEFFMMGLFSLMDVLMNRSLGEILKELPIAKSIKRSLRGMPGTMKDVYELVVAYEKGNWEQFSTYTSQLELAEEEGGELFLKAIDWSNEILEDTQYSA